MKRKFTKTISLLAAILMLTGTFSGCGATDNIDGANAEGKLDNTETVSSEVEKQSEKSEKDTEETEVTLKFNEDGSFKVLVFSDIHGDSAHLPDNVKNNIKTLVDRENPDLVLFDGDNTWCISSKDDIESCITDMVEYIESRGIYWAHVYGNHDAEGNNVSKKIQQKIYESFPHCLSTSGNSDINGIGNYVLPVYSNDEKTVSFAVWCLDSGSYMSAEMQKELMPVASLYNGHSFSDYATLSASQVSWYYNTSKAMKDKYGKVIPGIMAFHIPIPECYNAYVNRDELDWSGSKNEDICGSELNSGIFSAILERGDIKGMVFGHDHTNDFCFDYCGVKLCACSTVSTLCYSKTENMGARVFVATEGKMNVDTYMSYLDTSYKEVLHKKGENKTDRVFSDEILLDFNNGLPESKLYGYHVSLDESCHFNDTIITESKNRGVGGSGALAFSRTDFHGSNTADNFEIYLKLNEDGQLGNNKFLVVWMDLTGDKTAVDFRKADFGLVVDNFEARAYFTDNCDKKTPFYYLADGSTEWVKMSHGTDGCFGEAEGSSVSGFKGYFAFPVSNMLQYSTGEKLNSDDVITGIYFYGCLASKTMAGENVYIDDIQLVEDYKTLN